MLVDLRSDTVTRPTPAMRRAIAEAEVGDDVFGDDPTVSRLQEAVARLLGKEAALFVASGTMANQVAVRTHTEPGDEIVVEAGAHIVLHEGGGASALSGVSVRAVAGAGGLLDAGDVAGAIRPPDETSHYPPTRLVCLENTANTAGGICYRPDRVAGIAAVARERGLRLHLDGARLWNAAVALSLPPAVLAAPFDSVSVCLSKGLGCPVGSLLAGSAAFVRRAHRFRKMFGGGMRQAGVLAAAGLYALEHHRARLADDHARARRLAEALAPLRGLRVDPAGIETNLVYVGVDDRLAADAWVAAFAQRGVAITSAGPRRLRFVTHLDVDDDGISRAIEAAVAIARG